MIRLNIPYRANSQVRPSVWNFDPPFLEAGEQATIVGALTGGADPLYLVRRDRDSEERAVYRALLSKCGEFLCL